MNRKNLSKLLERLGDAVTAHHQAAIIECQDTGLRVVCLHEAVWRGQNALPTESIKGAISDLPAPADGHEWVLWMAPPQGFRDKGMLVFCEANSETGAMPPVFKVGA